MAAYFAVMPHAGVAKGDGSGARLLHQRLQQAADSEELALRNDHHHGQDEANNPNKEDQYVAHLDVPFLQQSATVAASGSAGFGTRCSSSAAGCLNFRA